MSKEFNYERSWREYVQPEYNKLSDAIRHIIAQTATVVDSLGQDENLALVGQTPELVAAFDAIPAEELAWASQVVYHYGYLASDGSAQKGGLYWKFQKLADASLINREKVDIYKSLSTQGLKAMRAAKIKMEKELKRFHDHKEGTEYDDEEAGEILSKISVSGVSVLRVDHVNHKPDVFCIGPKHFKKDSIYLDPNAAPCAHCGQPYSDHKSDRVAFVKVHNPDDKENIQGALKSILAACGTSGIKLDGFALVK